MLKNIFFIFALLMSNNVSVFAQEIAIGQKHTLHSNVLNEERKYWVHLPAKYNADKKYPVLYVLDGDRSFNYASGVISQLSNNGKAPELIMVSILNTDRNRDLTPTHDTIGFDGKEQPFLKTTGGSKNFLKFLKTELIPHIESDYKTEDFRILAGHSFGGLFAIYSFLEDANLFHSYIVIDPSLWWDKNILTTRLKEKMYDASTRNNFMYVSSANNSNPMMIDNQNQFFDEINKANIDTLSMTTSYFDDENHGSVDLLSFYHGLRFIYSGWSVSFEDAVENPQFIEEHFADLTQRLGYKIEPSENFIDRLAFSYIFLKDDKQQALKLFQRNVDNFPNSASAYDSLGTGYKEAGDIENAIKNYEKALEIQPGKENTLQRLQQILDERE